MDGPALLARQLLLRGQLSRNEVKAVLSGLPPAAVRQPECDALVCASPGGGGVLLRVEAQLVEAVAAAAAAGGGYDIQGAPPLLRLYWRKLALQSRPPPVKQLESGCLAPATDLNATGKRSLLAVIRGSDAAGVDCVAAATDYPGAQADVLALLQAGQIRCEGVRLFSAELPG